jgi:hypothetical protein
MRAGVVMAVWDNSNTTFTDYSTPDLNGTTLPFVWDVDVNSGLVRLRAVISSGTWTINVGTRVIF